MYSRLYLYNLACNITYGNTASTNSWNDFEIILQHPGQVSHPAIRLHILGFSSMWCMVRYAPNLQLVESNCKASSIQNSHLASKDIKMGQETVRKMADYIRNISHLALT